MMKSTSLLTMILSLGLATSAFADSTSDIDWINRHFSEVVRGPGASNDKDAILHALNFKSGDWVDKESGEETPALKPEQAKRLVDSLRYLYDHQPRLILVKDGAQNSDHVSGQTGIMSIDAFVKNYKSLGATIYGRTNDDNDVCAVIPGQKERFGCDYATMMEYIEFSQKYDPKAGKWSPKFDAKSTGAMVVSKTAEMLASGDAMTQRFANQIQTRIGERLTDIMVSVNENHGQPTEKAIAGKIDEIRNQVISEQIAKNGGYVAESSPDAERLPKTADKKNIDWIDHNFGDIVRGPGAENDKRVLLLSLGRASAAEVEGDKPLLNQEQAQKVVSALQYLKDHKPRLVLVKEGSLDRDMHRDSQIGVMTTDDFKRMYGSLGIIGTTQDGSTSCPLESGGKERVSCDFSSLMAYMEFSNKYDPKTQTWSPKFSEGSVGAQVVAQTSKILDTLNNPDKHNKQGVDNDDVALTRRYSNLIRKKVGEHLLDIILAVNASPNESVSDVVSKKVKEIEAHTISHEEKHGDSLN